jgi:predicted anti-sigma-YlaC factor YlaD
MNIENHERARKLLAARRIEGISPIEETWLDDHLAQCDDCSKEADTLALAINSLRTFSVTARPEAVRRASAAIRMRAEQRQQERQRAIPIWIAAVMSVALAIFTTPYTWAVFAWLGRILQVSDIAWQLGFLMWWFLPASVVAAVAARQKIVSNRESL